jgi:hypothetical protein
MIPIVTVDNSGWILSSIKDSLRWWLIKTIGPMQRIRYVQYSNMSFSMLSWIDSAITDPKLMSDFQRIIHNGRWKIC